MTDVRRRLKNPFVPYLAVWSAYFLWFWSRVFYFNESGHLVAAFENVWADWPAHFTMGSAMAYRDLILDQSPFVLGAPFGYPFLANQISAVLIRLGVPFFAAFTAPSFLLSVAVVAAVFAFFERLLKSRALALTASLLFLLNGGMGFLEYFGDVAGARNSWHAAFFPPRVYTRIDDLHIRWVNVVTSMIFPQRAFQLGFPLALATLVLLRPAGELFRPEGGGESPRLRRSIAAGALWGLLPVAHTHSFVAVSLIVPFWWLQEIVLGGGAALRRRLPHWTTAAGTAFFVAAPFLFNNLFPHVRGVDTVNWKPGWYAGSADIGWIAFWWRNWGPVPWLAAAGAAIVWRAAKGGRERAATVLFFLPFAVLFALPNLWTLQRYEWDNTKYIVWASVGFSALAAVAIRSLGRFSQPLADAPDGPPRRLLRLRRTAAGLVFLVCALSGALDVARAPVRSLNSSVEYTDEALALAAWARAETPADAVWLTGSAHNDWIFSLAGRQPVLAYVGWAWTHGYDYFQIERDVRTMFENPGRTDLFSRYRVDYAIVSNNAVEAYGADPDAWKGVYPLVRRTGNYYVYAVNPALATGRTPAVSPGGRRLAALTVSPERLRPGLVKTVRKGTTFAGELLFSRDGAVDLQFDTSGGAKRLPSPCTIVWEGLLDVPEEGEYGFSLASDDGSWLFVDGFEVVDNGLEHAVKKKSGRVRLAGGFHRIRVEYFDSAGAAVLRARWTPPGLDERDLPPSRLFHEHDDPNGS